MQAAVPALALENVSVTFAGAARYTAVSGVTLSVRAYLARDRRVPSGFMTVLELMVEFIRDSIALPNLGRKWVGAYTPLLLTLFVFILGANLVGLIPVFDILELVDHFAVHSVPGSFYYGLIHGGSTATANYNVTAALATITFFAIIIAGSRASVSRRMARMTAFRSPRTPEPLLLKTDEMRAT